MTSPERRPGILPGEAFCVITVFGSARNDPHCPTLERRPGGEVITYPEDGSVALALSAPIRMGRRWWCYALVCGSVGFMLTCHMGDMDDRRW